MKDLAIAQLRRELTLIEPRIWAGLTKTLGGVGREYKEVHVSETPVPRGEHANAFAAQALLSRKI